MIGVIMDVCYGVVIWCRYMFPRYTIIINVVVIVCTQDNKRLNIVCCYYMIVDM